MDFLCVTWFGFINNSQNLTVIFFKSYSSTKNYTKISHKFVNTNILVLCYFSTNTVVKTCFMLSGVRENENASCLPIHLLRPMVINAGPKLICKYR